MKELLMRLRWVKIVGWRGAFNKKFLRFYK